jgi:hypothetical protein
VFFTVRKLFVCKVAEQFWFNLQDSNPITQLNTTLLYYSEDQKEEEEEEEKQPINQKCVYSLCG